MLMERTLQQIAIALFEITNVSTQKVRFNDYVTGNTKVVNYGNQTMCIFQQVG